LSRHKWPGGLVNYDAVLSPSKVDGFVPRTRNVDFGKVSEPGEEAAYRVTSLIRNRLLLGPYSSPVPRGLGWS